MKLLQNLLDIDGFTSLMSEGRKKGKDSTSKYKDDCISEVTTLIYQDRTTTKENLREKARSYASNYFTQHPELSVSPDSGLIDDVADEVVKQLKDHPFDQRPLAGIVAQKDRNSVQEQPENKYIRLR